MIKKKENPDNDYLINNSEGAYIILSNDFTIMELNRSAEELLDFEKGCAIGTKFFQKGSFIDDRGIQFKNFLSEFSGSKENIQYEKIICYHNEVNSRYKWFQSLIRKKMGNHHSDKTSDRIILRFEKLPPEILDGILYKNLIDQNRVFKAIDHRVKNNFQMLTSLFSLKMHALKDDNEKNIISECNNYLSAVSTIYELLAFEDTGYLNIQKYFSNLIEALNDGCENFEDRIFLKNSGDPSLKLNYKKLLPCGLILAELVMNYYGLKNHKENSLKLSIIFQKDSNNLNQFLLANEADIAFKNEDYVNSFGYTIIQTLVKQIKGQIDINFDPEIDFKITFPD